MSSIEKKLQYIAYICFGFAALGLVVALVRLIEGDITNKIMFGLIFSALWYQAGAGILKKGKKSRVLAIVLFILYSISFVLGSYTIYIEASINDSYVDSTSVLTRMFILLIGLLSFYSAYILINKKTKKIFDNNKKSA